MTLGKINGIKQNNKISGNCRTMRKLIAYDKFSRKKKYTHVMCIPTSSELFCFREPKYLEDQSAVLFTYLPMYSTSLLFKYLGKK